MTSLFTGWDFTPGNLDRDEIVATGELYKLGGSKGGRRTWTLRKFVLTGIYMIYYAKNGEKKGEWIITNCKVKRVTPEEVNMPAAKHAFAVYGPGRYFVCCASSDKNCVAWMTVIADQIREFSNEIRRFLKTGEMVLANAVVKKKSLLGMGSTQRLVITNFPRLILISTKDLVVKEQIVWTRQNPPTFVAIDTVKFKIIYDRRELVLEDSLNGSKYWEEAFGRLNAAKPYTPKAQKSVAIDFQDFMGIEKGDKPPAKQKPQKTPKEEAKSEANLKFLNEALTNIEDLVSALSLRIDELDEEDAAAEKAQEELRGSVGTLSDEQKEAIEAAAQERREKRVQLEMLKQNVTVLASNLQTLVEKTTDNDDEDFEPLSLVTEDMQKIESVITETATMLMILTQNEQETVLEDEAIAEDEQGIVVEETVRLEDQMSALDAMVSSIELLSLADELLGEESFEGLEFTNLDNVVMDINPKTFQPTNLDSRPDHWKEVRMRRIVIKEYVDKAEGLDENTLREKRANRVKEEEKLMVQEVLEHGRLLNMQSLHPSENTKPMSVEEAAMVITKDNYDPNNPEKRPPAWKAIRYRRVLAQENDPSPDFMFEPSTLAKIEEEENKMIKEVQENGKIIWFGGPSVSVIEDDKEIVITKDNYNPNDTSTRPEGWVPERMRRVLVLEQEDRINGIDEDTIRSNRDKKIAVVDKQMNDEVLKHGEVQVPKIDKERRRGASVLVRSTNTITITADNFNPKVMAQRPDGWNDLRIKRVMLREHIDRIAGVSEDDLIEMRGDREIEEEVTMIDEVETSGKVLGLGDMTESINKTVVAVVPTKENFNPNDPRMRPEGWQKVKKKRVMIQEYLDRLAGIDEETLDELHEERELAEEAKMIGEVATIGKVTVSASAVSAAYDDSWKNNTNIRSSVGTLPTVPKEIVIEPTTFNPAVPTIRPHGWKEIRHKRVVKKEQLDRLRGVPEETIVEKRRERELVEETIMVEEVKKNGHLVGIGGPAKVETVKAHVAEDLDVNASNFDAADPAKRPKGWNEVKLRRVYIKEWKDRKEGLDESVILQRRFQREVEAEKEMLQEVSVRGRIRAYEQAIKRPTAPLSKSTNPRSSLINGKSAARKKQENMELQSFIYAANATISVLADTVAEVDNHIEVSAPKKSTMHCVLCGYDNNCAMCVRKQYSTENEDNTSSERLQSLVKPTPQTSTLLLSPSSSRKRASMNANGGVDNSPGARTSANIPGVRNARAPGPLKSDIKDLISTINADNFDVSDDTKRPQGWMAVRLKRVEEVEKVERARGVNEKEIVFKRAERVKEVERSMVEEVTISGKIKLMNQKASAPVFPKTFYANYAAAKSGAIKPVGTITIAPLKKRT